MGEIDQVFFKNILKSNFIYQILFINPSNFF